MCICRGQAHVCLGTMSGPLRRCSADLSSALLVRSKHGRPRGLRCRLPRRRRAINWVTTAARGPGCTRQAAARRLARHREGGAAWQHVVEVSLVRRSVERHVPRPTLLLDLGFWHVRRRLRDAFCHGGRGMLAGREVCALCQLGTGTGQVQAAPTGPSGTDSQLLHSRACWPRARRSRSPRSLSSCAASRHAAFRRWPPCPLRRGRAAARRGTSQHPAAASAGRSRRMGWAATSYSAVSRRCSVHSRHIEFCCVPRPTLWRWEPVVSWQTCGANKCGPFGFGAILRPVPECPGWALQGPHHRADRSEVRSK